MVSMKEHLSEINDDLMRISLEAWEKKASLRYVYTMLFEEIRELLVIGKVLEVGCGTGKLRDYLGKRCIGVDIDNKSRADVICNGGVLPFGNNVFNNVISVNLFHHIQYPLFFLQEVHRILSKNGRYIMVEPYMGFINRLLFSLFHHELCVKKLNITKDIKENIHYKVGNYYYSFWFFHTHYHLIKKYTSYFSVSKIKLTGSVLDFLNGGYTHRSLVPDKLSLGVSKIRRVFPLKGPDITRMIIVLEPHTPSGSND